MTVKIIPITPEYREGWEATFNKKSRDCKAEEYIMRLGNGPDEATPPEMNKQNG